MAAEKEKGKANAMAGQGFEPNLCLVNKYSIRAKKKKRWMFLGMCGKSYHHVGIHVVDLSVLKMLY
jgi:hypothetical protein